MYHQPLTKEDAAQYRYGSGNGNPKGYAYVPGQCAAVAGPGRYPRQCLHKAGKGPGGLYCGIHAKKVKIKDAP